MNNYLSFFKEGFKSMTEERKVIIISLSIGILMLLLAIPSIWPYGYYTFLRLIMCGISVYGAYKAYEWERQGWIWGMAIISVLFNPFIPIYLDKEMWIVIDLFVAGVYLVAIFILRGKMRRG